MNEAKLERNIGDYIAAIADVLTNGEATAAIMADVHVVIAAAHRAGKLEGRIKQARKDAEIIEANTVCYGAEGPLLRPRKDSGDREGFAYAAALRTEADRLEKEGGD